MTGKRGPAALFCFQVDIRTILHLTYTSNDIKLRVKHVKMGVSVGSVFEKNQPHSRLSAMDLTDTTFLKI